MKPFTCTQCHHTVFFENHQCQACGNALGYRPRDRAFIAFDRSGTAAPRCCANRLLAGCNWLLDTDDNAALCRSCRMNEVIPDLAVAGHAERWAAVERAKRRLLYTLQDLDLLPDAPGLTFRILAPTPHEAVITGHAAGVVTIDLSEADDVQREARRVSFGEPWRTLMGHLRHEVGHYLHHRWIAGRPELLDRWRLVFGDERADYAQALQSHHEGGPPADWAQRHVSAYASAHPHEDWAETCAHLLLVMDAAQTAQAWGLQLGSAAADVALDGPVPAQAEVGDLVVRRWLPVAQFLNAMNRSLGLPDSYPFVMPPAVVDKMCAAATLLADAKAAA